MFGELVRIIPESQSIKIINITLEILKGLKLDALKIHGQM